MLPVSVGVVYVYNVIKTACFCVPVSVEITMSYLPLFVFRPSYFFSVCFLIFVFLFVFGFGFWRDFECMVVSIGC